MMALSDVLNNKFDELLENCMKSGVIDLNLYQEYDVKRGLRDSTGNCMSYRPLYTAGGCLIFLCNRRIQEFCNIMQHIPVIESHNNAFPDILIPLDMRWYPDFQQDVCHINLHSGRD